MVRKQKTLEVETMDEATEATEATLAEATEATEATLAEGTAGAEATLAEGTAGAEATEGAEKKERKHAKKGEGKHAYVHPDSIFKALENKINRPNSIRTAVYGALKELGEVGAQAVAEKLGITKTVALGNIRSLVADGKAVVTSIAAPVLAEAPAQEQALAEAPEQM
jgi:hypothetical protein